jgi:hypothetical protein
LRQKSVARLSSDPDFRQRYSAAGNSYRDARVRAVFAMVPRLGPVLPPESRSTSRSRSRIKLGIALCLVLQCEFLCPMSLAFVPPPLSIALDAHRGRDLVRQHTFGCTHAADHGRDALARFLR